MMKKTRIWTLIAVAGLAAVCCTKPNDTPDPVPQPEPQVQGWPESGVPDAAYLNNGTVQIGVDLNRGGAIFHFSEAGKKRNLLNHRDAGRFVQQSYYGDSDGSSWNRTPWFWNPVQGGSWNGKNAEVLTRTVTDSQIRIVTRPMHWASGEAMKDCTMTELITLEGNLAKIHFSFTYSGSATYKARHQEMPAVFVDGTCSNLVYYDGKKPWTGDSVKSVVPGNRSDGATNQYVTRTEDWSAYVDGNGWGIGVYTPGTMMMTFYRHGKGTPSPTSDCCSYLSPIRTEGIKPGTSFTYDVYLTAGTVPEIRERFAALRK